VNVLFSPILIIGFWYRMMIHATSSRNNIESQGFNFTLPNNFMFVQYFGNLIVGLDFLFIINMRIKFFENRMLYVIYQMFKF